MNNSPVLKIENFQRIKLSVKGLINSDNQSIITDLEVCDIMVLFHNFLNKEVKASIATKGYRIAMSGMYDGEGIISEEGEKFDLEKTLSLFNGMDAKINIEETIITENEED